jgi:hypothetical protein
MSIALDLPTGCHNCGAVLRPVLRRLRPAESAARALVHTVFVLFFYWLGAIIATAVIIVPVVFWR